MTVLSGRRRLRKTGEKSRRLSGFSIPGCPSVWASTQSPGTSLALQHRGPIPRAQSPSPHCPPNLSLPGKPRSSAPQTCEYEKWRSFQSTFCWGFHGGGGPRRREVDSRAPALTPHPPHPKPSCSPIFVIYWASVIWLLENFLKLTKEKESGKQVLRCQPLPSIRDEGTFRQG